MLRPIAHRLSRLSNRCRSDALIHSGKKRLSPKVPQKENLAASVQSSTIRRETNVSDAARLRGTRESWHCAFQEVVLRHPEIGAPSSHQVFSSIHYHDLCKLYEYFTVINIVSLPGAHPFIYSYLSIYLSSYPFVCIHLSLQLSPYHHISSTT